MRVTSQQPATAVVVQRRRRRILSRRSRRLDVGRGSTSIGVIRPRQLCRRDVVDEQEEHGAQADNSQGAAKDTSLECGSLGKPSISVQGVGVTTGWKKRQLLPVPTHRAFPCARVGARRVSQRWRQPARKPEKDRQVLPNAFAPSSQLVHDGYSKDAHRRGANAQKEGKGCARNSNSILSDNRETTLRANS